MMLIMLETRICDLDPRDTNTQTVREFIRELEDRVGCIHEDLDSMDEEQIYGYIELLYIACIV